MLLACLLPFLSEYCLFFPGEGEGKGKSSEVKSISRAFFNHRGKYIRERPEKKKIPLPPHTSSFSFPSLFLFLLLLLIFTPPTQNPSSSSSPRQQSTQTTISAHSEYTFHSEQKQNSHFLDLRRRIFRLRCPRDSIWKKRKKKSIIISDLFACEKKRRKKKRKKKLTHAPHHS